MLSLFAFVFSDILWCLDLRFVLVEYGGVCCFPCDVPVVPRKECLFSVRWWWSLFGLFAFGSSGSLKVHRSEESAQWFAFQRTRAIFIDGEKGMVKSILLLVLLVLVASYLSKYVKIRSFRIHEPDLHEFLRNFPSSSYYMLAFFVWKKYLNDLKRSTKGIPFCPRRSRSPTEAKLDLWFGGAIWTSR